MASASPVQLKSQGIKAASAARWIITTVTTYSQTTRSERTVAGMRRRDESASATISICEVRGSAIVAGDEPNSLMGDRSPPYRRLFPATPGALAADVLSTSCMIYWSWAGHSGVLSAIVHRGAIKCLSFSTLHHGKVHALTQGMTGCSASVPDDASHEDDRRR